MTEVFNPALIAIGAGVLLSGVVFGLFAALRRFAALPTAIVGWVASAAILLAALSMIACALGEGLKDPAPMTMVWLALGVALLVLLGLCASVGVVHRRCYALPFWRGFGITVAEAVVAIAAGALLTRLLPENFGPVSRVWFYLTVFVSLYGMEFAIPRFQRAKDL